MTIAADRLLAVGTIVKVFGIKGEVIVRPLTDFPERLARARVLWLGPPGGGVTRTGVEHGSASPQGIRLKLKGIDTRSEAEAARGMLLFVDEEHRARLRKGEYFVHDVVGLAVRSEDGEALGVVADVLRYPGGDVYLVRGGGREFMIPAVREFIRAVDIGAGSMTVRLIEGMADV